MLKRIAPKAGDHLDAMLSLQSNALSVGTDGGIVDPMTRVASEKAAQTIGQPFVLEHRPGSGGVIAADLTAKARADGYTILMANTAHTVQPSLHAKLPYDAVKDFAPVSLLTVNPTLLVAHVSVSANNVKELVALAKARPGKLNYASVGSGSPVHLAMEWFKQSTGTDLVHVPYKGSGPGVLDVISGRLQYMLNPMPEPVLCRSPRSPSRSWSHV